ncbi:MAG: YfhO family protein [Culturomica sp.]|jgi:hypothetical protein|nr:YfhO family protein [Culturomica sp.]
MKRYFVILLCVLMAACATTKKSTQTTKTADMLAERSTIETTDTEKLVDTTRTDKGKITITEIEFFPPVTASDARPPDQASPPGANASGLNLPNIGNIGAAAVKSIKQTTIESDSERKGESKESSSTTAVKNEAMAANTEKTVNVEQAPAPDPYRWRYIFYILVLGVIVFLYLKRVPVLNWIKKILVGIKQIFKFS